MTRRLIAGSSSARRPAYCGMESGCRGPILTAVVIVAAVVLTILQPWKLAERPVQDAQERKLPPPPGVDEPEESESAPGER